ncbi:MAG TPA: DUF4349 domain-containing protein [Ignavibacteria bacterium]|nr:hypothetical protein [Bacteroidota bacterium]HRI84837.1 DUF4349 domain-containing protein [Ignavibacteria bacterium]HRK00210.1 DUF4349 domain-containing protein [Ignavibacteria bacterium]
MKNLIRSISAVAFSVLLLIYSGCSKKNDSGSDNQSAPVHEGASVDQDNLKRSYSNIKQKINDQSVTSASLENPVVNERMFIRNGNIGIETENLTVTENKISEIVKEFNGYITASSSKLNAAGKKQGSITARVPASNFDPFLKGLAAAGNIMSQDISGDDVTSEFIDLTARLKTQRELEKRLLDLLNTRTDGLSDVVNVEEKLSAVRERIESTEGRMNFLKNQSAYSTVSISLYEPSMLQTASGSGFLYEMENSVKEGLQGFIGMFGFMITFIISSLPLIVMILLAIYFFRKFYRQRKLKLQKS